MSEAVEYAALKEVLKCSLNKEGLMKVLKKNTASFMTDIFKGVASRTLVRLILEMVGGEKPVNLMECLI